MEATDRDLVSVIVPCFNHARFLPDCLASLQAQTHRRWEAILVNDGSTDDTANVARRYLAAEPRLKYVEQRNQGQAAARNRGLDEARGAYIQFLDADDVIAPQKLELQIKVLGASDDLALAYCDYRYGSEDDVREAVPGGRFCKPRFVMKRPIEDMAARWETEFSIPIHCFLFDARLFRSHGIRFDEALTSHEDWDCWMRVLALKPRVEHVPGELAVYRKRKASVSHDLTRMRRAFRKAVDAQLRLCGQDAVLTRLLQRKRASMERSYVLRIWAQRLGLLRLKSYFPQGSRNSP